MAGLYVRGAWPLGFVMLLPWLLALGHCRRVRSVLASATLMAVAFTAAVFPWFGAAIGRFSGTGEAAGMAALLLAAPLLQPPFIAFALARHGSLRAHGPGAAAAAGAAAWVATEWVWPKLLGDTLGHGLYPSPLLRQAAELGGAAGLTLVLLLSNQALLAAWQRRAQGARALAAPLAAAVALPLLLALHGLWALAGLPASDETLRMGLVQSNIVDYERLRREKGAGQVVREVLDTHYAMSHAAVERQRVQAVLWSETVYPTTFGRPKSEAGAELDQEIATIVNAAGVPFVFGTYDRDDAGEYNAAAFLAPGQGLVGMYRKTRPFPLTESVPDWLDGPALRRWLPWAGGWRAGNGARVLPLRLADGRELPALPLICLDAVDPGLAIAGARLGARVILGLSNDSWFTEHPLGAELHLAVAAFRSIETRLPQFRVTSNGYSAVIDASGAVRAGTRMGERTLVIGELPVGEPPRTLMVAWGNWVGGAALAGLALWLLWSVGRAVSARRGAAARPAGMAAGRLPMQVAVLPPAARAVVALLRMVSRGGLLVLAAAALLGSDGLQAGTLAQLRAFAAAVLAPELAAACVLRAYRARITVDGGQLVLARAGHRLSMALSDIATVEAWRWPLPAPGASLRLRTPPRPTHDLAGVDAEVLAAALQAGGGRAELVAPRWLRMWLQARRGVPQGLLQQAWVRFGVLPLLLALPAYRLHQHIAYGSGVGEWLSFGLPSYLAGFGFWWASWAVGVALVAAVLRAAVEALTLAAALGRPAQAAAWRRGLEQGATALLFAGLPALLAWRALGS
ncbi:MAG: apolipoprotein N-acyltransferase [Rubrivivax sp.]